MLLQYEDCNFPRLLTCKRRNEEVSSRCIHWSNLPPLTLKLPGYYWTQKGGKKRPPLLLYKAPTLSWERARAEQSHKREIRNYPWILLSKPKAAKQAHRLLQRHLQKTLGGPQMFYHGGFLTWIYLPRPETEVCSISKWPGACCLPEWLRIWLKKHILLRKQGAYF